MFNSQFNIYQSSDEGAPQITGTLGTFLPVIDACLVTGYGAKAPAGWSKPYANVSNVGSVLMGGGSNCALIVNDNAAGGSAGYVAWTWGARSLTAYNTGVGVWPNTGLVGLGHFVVFKSSAASLTTPRTWTVYADAYGFHMFIYPENTAEAMQGFSFGDIFSYYPGATDTGRCHSSGWTSETLGTGNSHITTQVHGTASADNTMACSASGMGTAILIGRHGDTGRQAVATYLSGSGACPNAADNSIYLAPMVVVEGAGTRGQIRGMWHICHGTANFTHGQLIYGTGSLAGKVIQVVKPILGTAGALGFCGIEVSATVETNS